ncbi:sulfite exporter TauE/SafE family protein [Nesterenkonia muleiensis]|uniref:sulfite exporter TauE/SafE family protein n=1 Tax=Nesterenkonia muleiensis TaxID=2282648 RepID=UPI003B75B4C7
MTLLLSEITAYTWALLVLAALLVGVSKTAMPDINTLSIAIFAAVLPVKASTGALLLLLIVGDVFALSAYRRHAHWPTLIRLIPAVIAGLAFGAVFLAIANDASVQRVIALILLCIIGFTLWQRRQGQVRPTQDNPPILPLPPITTPGTSTSARRRPMSPRAPHP